MTSEERPTVPDDYVPALMVTEEMITERDWGRNQIPAFRVSEVAKVFFGMSESWLRRMLRPDETHPDTWFVSGGQRMEFRRKDPGKTDSERVFLLSDVEQMAWSLFRFGAIKPRRLAQVLRLVEAEAHLFGLLTDEPPDDEEE